MNKNHSELTIDLESARHNQLKLAALAALKAAGFTALAAEVGCPLSAYRLDVAAHRAGLSNLPKRGIGPPILPGSLEGFLADSTTVIVECKQSRGDFLRDSRCLEALLTERQELDKFRRELEEKIIRVAEPHLAGSGNLLFSEMEDWDFGTSRLPSYRKTLRLLRRVDQQIHGQTKFWAIARYALADAMLIAAPKGLLRPEELPVGWGLLEFPVSAEGPAITEMQSRPRLCRPETSPRPSTQKVRATLLRNIAVAASREAWRGRLPEVMPHEGAYQAPADSPTA